MRGASCRLLLVAGANAELMVLSVLKNSVVLEAYLAPEVLHE